MEVLVRINMEVTVAPAGQDLPERIAKKVIGWIDSTGEVSSLSNTTEDRIVKHISKHCVKHI